MVDRSRTYGSPLCPGGTQDARLLKHASWQTGSSIFVVNYSKLPTSSGTTWVSDCIFQGEFCTAPRMTEGRDSRYRQNDVVGHSIAPHHCTPTQCCTDGSRGVGETCRGGGVIIVAYCVWAIRQCVVERRRILDLEAVRIYLNKGSISNYPLQKYMHLIPIATLGIVQLFFYSFDLIWGAIPDILLILQTSIDCILHWWFI